MNKLWSLLPFSLFLLTLGAQVKKLYYHCVHASDFSIYQEAIYKMAYLGDFNPYLHVRNLHIFNDHFDPIIILTALWTKVLGYWPGLLLVFENLFLLGIAVIIFLLRHLTWKEKIIASTLLFFLKGIMVGISFPIHPTTWVMLPAFCLPLIVGLQEENKQRKTLIYLFPLVIFLFKESFAFSVFMLSFYFYLFERRTTGPYYLILSLLMLSFNFYFRGEWLGETMPYGRVLIQEYLDHPWKKISQFELVPLLKNIYPFFIPFFFILKSRKLTEQKELFSVLCFLAPLVGIQVLANKFHFQYMPQIVAPLFGLLLLPKNISLFRGVSPRLKVLAMVLFVASGMGEITKHTKALVLSKSKKCDMSSAKEVANLEMRKLMASIDLPADPPTILASGGVIPMLLHPWSRYYQMGVFSKKLTTYDYLLLEKKGGDRYPYSMERVAAIDASCSQSNNIVLNNDFFLVVKKPSALCLKNIPR